ncbi:MYXO-CTERM sorting domain-containing protein [Nannocystaceae bacterium ST9]
MRNRLPRFASLALGLGLAAFVLAPGTAHALLVQCADENGECEITNDGFDSIECTCANDSAFGGTGGDDWANLSEEELMDACLSELAFCAFGESETGVDTLWSDSGWVDTGDWGSDSGWGDTGWSDSGWGESGWSDSDSGWSGTDTGSTSDEGESGSTSDEGDSSGESDTGSTEGGSTSDEGDSTSESTTTSGSEAADEAGSESESGETGTGDAGVEDGDLVTDEGCSCNTSAEPGYGIAALFGLFGLLAIRPRRRD